MGSVQDSTSHEKRPSWIAPGLVMCESCFVTESFRDADDHWRWDEPDTWTCPECESRGVLMSRVDRPGSTSHEGDRKRRVAIAGWIAGLVLGLSVAFWWTNVYVSLFVLMGGVVLSLVVWRSV